MARTARPLFKREVSAKASPIFVLESIQIFMIKIITLAPKESYVSGTRANAELLV